MHAAYHASELHSRQHAEWLGLELQVICEGTNSQDVRVREASFECFVKIASSYYDKLPPYMASSAGLFGIYACGALALPLHHHFISCNRVLICLAFPVRRTQSFS